MSNAPAHVTPMQAYWWGMLDDTGLAKMDTEQRRRMTYSEVSRMQGRAQRAAACGP